MRIATFNVNSVRARLPIVTEWLAKNRPDVLCAQETKVQDIAFPVEEIEQIGYRSYFKGQKGYNGVAVFTLEEAADVCFGLDSEPCDEARIVTVRVGEVTIVNTYVPQGDSVDSVKFLYKLEWFKRLRRYFENNFKASNMVLWTGDFNVAPEAIDVYRPEEKGNHVCFCPAVREALGEVMGWGFEDVFRRHCSEAGQYSFWDYRLTGSFERNLGWRLDHFMATRVLAERSVGCYIDKLPRGLPRPSDHTPVVAEFAV